MLSPGIKYSMPGIPDLVLARYPSVNPIVGRWHPHRSWSIFKSATNVAWHQISNFCITSRKGVCHPLDLSLTPQVWNPYSMRHHLLCVRRKTALCVIYM